MESISPCLELLICVRRKLEKGQTTAQGLRQFLSQPSNEFTEDVLKWYRTYELDQCPDDILSKIRSPHRRALLHIIERGLRGEPIYQTLTSFELEIIEACHDDLTRSIAKLPFMMLIPLLILVFPAFLLLLFGPLLQSFLSQIGGS